MDINRRALYNSLRMNWILDPSLEVEPWQVEDYRAMPLDSLFERLEDMEIYLDKSSFVAFAEDVDSPEELTEALLHEANLDAKVQDQIYLLLFELWRRLLPERSCLTILCDEIDHQIHLYDQSEASSGEEIADVLANLQVILDDNTDEGGEPHEVFATINSGCANDLESFLYDYIADRIDEGNYTYATELLEGFSGYIQDTHWFEFLRARLLSVNDPEEADALIKQLLKNKQGECDLTFNLEVLAFLVSVGDRETFERLVKKTAKCVQLEEDFQSLISIAADFYHRLDREHIEKSLQTLLKERNKRDPGQHFDNNDPDLSSFFKILATS